MNYPEHIYNKYEIVEKEIYGAKYYGLVRIYNFFGIKIKRHVKVYAHGKDFGRISKYSGHTWVKYKGAVESAIEGAHRSKEYQFEERMTK